MKRRCFFILVILISLYSHSNAQNKTVINIQNNYGDIISDKKVVKNYTIVSSQEYRTLNYKYSGKLKSNLKTLLKKYPIHPTVLLRVENGNSNRDKIALYLDTIFRKDSLGYFPSGNVLIGIHPNTQIHINYSQKNHVFVKDFINALSSYINAEYTLNDGLEDENFVIFYIAGMPLFDSFGRVKIQ